MRHPVSPRARTNRSAPGSTTCQQMFAHDPNLQSASGSRIRLFADAGIDMLLRECPPSLSPVPADAVCEQDFGPMILGVQIVPRDERKSTAPAERLFGFALPFNDDGIHATIFYQRTEQAAAQKGVSVRKLLGDIMAHEIGHLLLWSNAHARAGIMTSCQGHFLSPACQLTITVMDRELSPLGFVLTRKRWPSRVVS